MCSSLVCEFGAILAALLIVIDPLGAVPIILSAVGFVGSKQGKRLVLRVVAGSTILLLFFTIAGTYLLRLFGVTLDDLRIGGGLLLLIIALRIVVGGRFGPDDEDHEGMVVPLITPLIVGPGAITAAVVLARIHGVPLTAAAAIAAMILCLVLFLASRYIHRIIGDSATHLTSRVLGVFVAAIAISYMRAGVLDVIRQAQEPVKAPTQQQHVDQRPQ